MQFQASVYRGYLLKGDLPGAMAYLARFPEQAPLCEKFQARFVREAVSYTHLTLPTILLV